MSLYRGRNSISPILLKDSGKIGDIDNLTITKNSLNKIQAVGLINQNDNLDSTNPLIFWQGTEQEWEVGGETDTYYAWKGAGINPNEHSTYSTTYGAVFSGAYGNGKFVMVSKDSKDYGFSYYSTDGGNTWTYNKPSDMFKDVRRVIYVNDMFIAKSRNEPLYFSSDGINWTDIPFGAADGYGICWTGLFYVTVPANGGASKISNNLTSWLNKSAPSIGGQALAYGEYNSNQIIICVGEGGIDYITPSDLDSDRPWTSILSGDYKFYDVIYHNGKFVAVGLNCSVVIDITGETPTVTLKGNITASSIVYVDGKYYTIGNFTRYPSAPTSSNSLYYINESDLLNENIDWTTYTLPETLTYSSVVTDGQKLILNDNFHTYFVKIDLAGEVFTLESEPTTESTVYSAPEVESVLTITSVGTGTITLSDNSIYNYNSEDNITIPQSVGKSHPNWLCGIENVGVKKGNILIGKEYSVFNGTNGITIGTSGLVPAPNISDANKFLNSDGTWKSLPIEQSYDPTSGNAISGVAINNAKFLKNNNNSASGLTILGTSNYANSVTLGYSSTSTNSNSVSVGAYSSAGRNSVAIGYYANASATGSIQIGYGTANANTFSVGFSEYDDYQLLDGTTGKIPNARINIDNTPIENSTNTITSGAIYNSIGTIESVLDSIIAQGSN